MPHLADLNRDMQKPKQIILDYDEYKFKNVGDIIDHEGNTYKIIDMNYEDATGRGVIAEEATIGDFQKHISSGQCSMRWIWHRNPKTGRMENYFPDEEEWAERDEAVKKRNNYHTKSTKKRTIFVLKE